MRFVDAATLKGDGSSNQDHYLIGDYYAAVFDGASAYPPEPYYRDGGWYARELAEAIRIHMAPSGDLRGVLQDALKDVRREHDLRADGPSSTVALVRWGELTLDCLVLGDSPIALMHRDGDLDVITDRRLSAIGDDKRTAYEKRLRDGGGFDDEHRELLHSLQAEQRKHRNKPDGYWIAADDPAAAGQALSRRFRVDSVRAAVLMTDGASAMVDRFGVTTWGALPGRLSHEGCTQFLVEVQQAELSDPMGRLFPRSKLHDDKTAILIANP